MKSAIYAGYSKGMAKNATVKLLKQDKIKLYIDNQVSKMQSADIMDAESIMSYLSRVISGKEKDIKLIKTPQGIEQVEQQADINTKILASRELLKRYPENTKIRDARLEKLKAETKIKDARAKDMQPSERTQSDKEFEKLDDKDLRKLARHY